MSEGAPVGLTLANLDMMWNAPRHAISASSRWQTTLWVWVALAPAAVVINLLLVPRLGSMPSVPRTLLTSVIRVPRVTWIGLPLVHFPRAEIRNRAKSLGRSRP